MRLFTASLYLPLLPSVLSWTFPSHQLDRRAAFELIEREDSVGGNGWIVPANVTVDDWDTAEPGEGWIPAEEYLKMKGIAPLGSLDDSSTIEEIIEPLSLPPSKRALFSKRAGGTRVNIGRKQTDYGCEASIRTPISEALNLICSNGFCDQSITYVRTIDWLDNGWGSGKSRRQSRVDIKGNYRGPQIKGHFIEAAKRTVNPDTTSTAKRTMKIDTPTCMRWGICKSLTCNMSKFGNFISISKLDDWDTYISIDMNVKLHSTNDNCLARKILAAVGGSISSIEGGFFGVAEAFNPGC